MHIIRLSYTEKQSGIREFIKASHFCSFLSWATQQLILFYYYFNMKDTFIVDIADMTYVSVTSVKLDFNIHCTSKVSNLGIPLLCEGRIA